MGSTGASPCRRARPRPWLQRAGCAAAAGRIEGLHRVGDPRRGGDAARARGRRPRSTPPRARRHAPAVGRAPGRRHRRLPRVHRHHRPGDPAGRASPTGRRPCAARGAGACSAAGVRQHLRARDARGRGRAPGHRDDLRPARATRTCASASATSSSSRADGWPALRARYGLPHARVQRAGSRPRLPGLVAGAIDVTDLYTTDAEIAQLRPARAGGRPRLLPALRRGAGLPRRPRRAAARGLRGAAPAARARIAAREMTAHERARCKLEARAGAGGRGRLPGGAPRRGGVAPPRTGRARALCAGRASTSAGRRRRCWRRVLVGVPLGVLAARRPRRRAGSSGRGRRRADDPVAGAAGVHDPARSGSARCPAHRRRCFSTACCRSCATRTPGWSGSRRSCASRRRRSACRRGATLRLIELPLAVADDPGRHQDARR